MITRGMLHYILGVVPELEAMPIKKQIWFVNTCFSIGSGYARKHKIDSDSFFLGSVYIRESFGDYFYELNDRYTLVCFGDTWEIGLFARTCVATPVLKELIAAFHASEYCSINQRIDSNGHAINCPRKAIASKDAKGQTAVIRSELSSIVEIDLQAIEQLIMALGERFCLSPKDERILASAKLLMHLAPNGQLHQTYQESDSGRLYGQGFSLQNCPRELRKTALSGMFDHDIQNCHFSILQGLSRKHGLETPQIDYYVERRQEELERLSELTGEEVGTLKVVFLALVYGAGGTALRTMLLEGYDEFVSDLEVIALRDEVRNVGRQIITLDGTRTQRGNLINVLGKSIDYEPNNFGRNLAHILQGYEAAIMQEILNTNSGQIVLLQHDGYTMTEVVDMGGIESWVKDQYDMDIRYEVEQLTPNMGI